MVAGLHCSQKALNHHFLFIGAFLLSWGGLAESGYNQIQKRTSEILPELLKDPLLSSRYEQCQEYRFNEKFDMGECLWDGFKKDGKDLVPPLSAQEREEIQKKIQGRANIDVTTTKASGNPALKKLEEYYAKRLAKEIMGEHKKNEKKIMADHTIYNRIYRSQLGKNVISALSSYCLDADGENYLVDKNKREETRKDNLKQLEKQVIEGDVNTSQAYAHWSNCASRISHICQNTCPDKTENKITKYCCENDCDSDLFKHSQVRACEVVDYIQAIRQNLLALDKIDKVWEKKTAKGFAGNLVTGVDVEKITNLSSKEVVEKSGYSKEQEKLVEEMEECIKNFVPEQCKKFVSELNEEDSSALDEYSLRTRIIQEKIDKINTTEKKEDSLESYLKEEGYSKEEIAKMLEEEDSAKLQEKIAQRFRAKRKALQTSLKERFNETRVNKDEDPTGKLKNIQKKALNEKKRLAELVFFTNMISGFLKVGDAEGNILGTNTEALQQELKDSIFTPDNDSLSPIDFKTVKEIGDKIGDSPERDSNTQESRNLNVKTINEALLNYE